MKTSKNGFDIITKYEGLRLNAYKCPAGIWTIGYGHTLGVKKGDTITKEKAIEFLAMDLETAETKVNAIDNIYHFTQNEFDALVSFVYNVGNVIGVTGYCKRSKKEIASAMLLYTKANGKTLTGLQRRRQEEYNLFTRGKKTNEEIADEVVEGKWSTGRERTKLLTAAGYDAKEIQKIVNKKLKTK